MSMQVQPADLMKDEQLKRQWLETFGDELRDLSATQIDEAWKRMCWRLWQDRVASGYYNDVPANSAAN